MTRAAIALCLLLLSPAGQVGPSLPGPLLSLDCGTKSGTLVLEQFTEGFLEVRISHDDVLIDPETGEDDYEESWYVARIFAPGTAGIEAIEFPIVAGWWYRGRAQHKEEAEPQVTHWMRCEP